MNVKKSIFYAPNSARLGNNNFGTDIVIIGPAITLKFQVM